MQFTVAASLENAKLAMMAPAIGMLFYTDLMFSVRRERLGSSPDIWVKQIEIAGDRGIRSALRRSLSKVLTKRNCG